HGYVPKWMQEQDFIKSMEYRPQIAWLPLVPNRGIRAVLPQEGKRELLQERLKRLQQRQPHQHQQQQHQWSDQNIVLTEA
ncbi:hypothetical protein BGZ65_002604, partial [Modicella reniformis]